MMLFLFLILYYALKKKLSFLHTVIVLDIKKLEEGDVEILLSGDVKINLFHVIKSNSNNCF